jgi:hypothetical protein
VRNTLRSKVPNSDRFKCDLVIGVQKGFEMGATTRSYYRSTYALTYVKGKGLDSIKTPEDLLALDPAKRKSLRLGVFAGSPAVDWVLQNGMIEQIVPYQMQTGDADQYPGEVVEKDLAQGLIDVAFVWGPIAGYFAKNATTASIAAIPFKPHPDIRFDFDIAMAVRHSDKPFRDRIDQLIVKNAGKIKAILTEYGVPLVDERGEVLMAVNGK